MKRLALSLLLVLATAGLGGAGGSTSDPVTITVEAARIDAILDKSNWVSPSLNGSGGSGPALYLVSFRDCPGCRFFEKQQMPGLLAAGVDMRVIMFARPDVSTIRQSTKAERATVAELWINRDWTLLQRWLNVTPAGWEAKGVPPADGDADREKALNISAKVADALMDLTGENGLIPAVPLLIWHDRDGRLRACHCDKAKALATMRGELGLP